MNKIQRLSDILETIHTRATHSTLTLGDLSDGIREAREILSTAKLEDGETSLTRHRLNSLLLTAIDEGNAAATRVLGTLLEAGGVRLHEAGMQAVSALVDSAFSDAKHWAEDTRGDVVDAAFDRTIEAITGPDEAGDRFKPSATFEGDGEPVF